MRKSIIVACGVMLAASPAFSQSFKAKNRMIVNPISSSVFEVVETRSLGASGSWCAAADYATRVLGVTGKSELIVKTPRGQSVTDPRRKGVAFTLDPGEVSEPLSKSVSPSTKIPGQTLPVGHALAFCSQSLIDIGP